MKKETATPSPNTPPIRLGCECAACQDGCPKSTLRYWQEVEGKFAPCKYRPRGKTFADYEVTADNEMAFKIARWYVKEKPERSLYLYGGTGTGKTTLAKLIAREFEGVIFGDVPSLLSRLKATFDKGGTEEVLDGYGTCELLVLDDLGAGQVTDWSVGIIYQIINARYSSGRRLIVTSNFDLKGLEERLASRDKFSAQRIVSRLKECIPAYLGTVDRRKQKC